MFEPAAEAAKIRASYGPEELQALEAYTDVTVTLGTAGLHPYIETRGGLAVCAYASDGTLVVVASHDALPLRRSGLSGWHITHVPEDTNCPPWRCVVHDTTPDDPERDRPGDLDLDAAVEAITRHLSDCFHVTEEAGA
ncbi:hypothetical protein [Streptomyces violascens]|uniref:Uncharacterized protein n=1 Tax=Streptomyces violascens TaxID=67381 RepID=A0ABQ3QV86_9ACTN|nr:hypothetical protein [Streptomyces violascens]GGU26430.1 hypothetical protein GCM10010289_54670 [Streptomyces violascens]GHI41204.1 hypothetical protein Sviol_56120 [Streptomyces violascens]